MPALFAPLIAAGISGITGLAATSTAVTFLTGIIVAAAGYLLTSLMAPSTPKPQDGHVPIQQPVPYRIYGYGTARVAGAVMLLEEYSNDLLFVAALVGHEIVEFISFYANDDQLLFDEGPFDGTTDGFGTVSRGPKHQYGGRFWYYWQTGTSTQTAISDIVAASGGMWTTDHRLRGNATLGMIVGGQNNPSTFTLRYPYGRPQPSAVIRMRKVWDFRDDGQDPTDDSTWAYSDNPVLCLAHFECFNEFGPQRDYTKALMPVIDAWKTEADVCDESVSLAEGGTQNRYVMGGWSTTEIDPKATRLAMLAACDGWMAERGDGALIIRAGKFSTPTVTLTDDDIVGFYLQGDIAEEDVINDLHIEYNSPAHAYSEVECDPWVDEDDQAARGKDLASTSTYHWCQDFRQARRLGKRDFYRARQLLRGSLTLKLSGINAIYERFVEVNSNIIPRMNGVVIENRSVKIDILQGTFEMPFIGSGPDIDDWTPADDEGTAPPLPPVTDPTQPPSIGNLSVTAERISGNTYLDCVWDDPGVSGVDYDAQWRLADDGSGSPGAWHFYNFPNIDAPSGGRLEGRIPTVPQNAVLEVEVRSYKTVPGDWTTPPNSVDTSEPAPGSPTSLTATGHSGFATIAFDAPNSAGLVAAVRVYRDVSGGTFGAATDVSGPIAAVANQHISFDDTVAAGAYDYWATAENSAGTASTPTGPQGATVT